MGKGQVFPLNLEILLGVHREDRKGIEEGWFTKRIASEDLKGIWVCLRQLLSEREVWQLTGCLCEDAEQWMAREFIM